MSSRRSGGVRGSLNDSFPIVGGSDGERLTAQLDEAVAALGTLLDQGPGAWAAGKPAGWWSGGKASPFTPRIEVQAAAPGSSVAPLVRVSAAVPACDFTLSDALGAFAFLHIHTHAPQVVQSLFPSRVELARILALLPLSGRAPALSQSKPQRGAAGGGPDSSVLRLQWGSGKRKQLPMELVLAQRTGRLRTGGAGGDCVYHLCTSVRDPEQIPALAGGVSSGGNGNGAGSKAQREGVTLALLVGHSEEQGCLEAALLLSQGVFLDAHKDAALLRAATAALGCYLAETIAAHRRLSLGLPDLTLALISPFANMHRILLRMPEASQPPPQQHGQHPARLSSASAQSSNGGSGAHPAYRVISIRFVCAIPGLFTVAGLAPQDQALLPAWVMEKIMYHPFQGGEVAEVRFVASSETKELTLVWSGLGKGRLHRYIVDVKLVHRSALARTLALLEASFHLPRAGATHAARLQQQRQRQLAAATTFDVAHRPTCVSVVRYPQQLREALVPLALALPVPLSTTAKRRVAPNERRARRWQGVYGTAVQTGVATSYAASLSASILQHLIHPPGRLVAALDALWPLLLWASFHAFLYYGLRSFPEFVAALDGMPLWGLALGLGLVHLSLGLTLHALVTSKVPLYLRLAHLEFHLLTPRWWWRVVVHSHLLGTVLATLLLGLAARVMTLRGGLAESRFVMAFLLCLQLENLAEDKLLLISGMGALTLLVALAVTGLHLLAGSNRALNVGLIVLLDRLGVLKPIEAPVSYLLHPFGRHLHAPHRSSSAGTSTAASASARDPLAQSTSSSLDASGATANSTAIKTPVKDAGVASSPAPASAASSSRVSSLRKGLSNVISPASTLSKKMAATPISNASLGPAPTPASEAPAPTTPYKSSLASPSPHTPASGVSSVSSTYQPRSAPLFPLVSPPPARTPASAAIVAPGTAGTGTPVLLSVEEVDSPAAGIEAGAQAVVERRDAAVQHDNEEDAAAAVVPTSGGGGGGGYGETVEPDFERTTARTHADRAMLKSGLVKELRATGSGLTRHRVWKDVWLVVDAELVTVYKRKDESNTAVIHHRIPILELGVRRILTPDHAGFAIYGPGVSGQQGIELRCEGGEGEADKWVSTMNWNQLVAGRKQSQHA